MLWRPTVGIAPRITDAELVTLAVMQALLGHVSEARWLRYSRAHLPSRHARPARRRDSRRCPELLKLVADFG
jgi:hypothetical protein